MKFFDCDHDGSRGAVLRQAVDILGAAGIEDARRNAEWIICDVADCSRAGLYAYPEKAIPSDQCELIGDMIARRTLHEPLQYILGSTEFFDLRLKVSPDVLIPRPETEQLVEEALRIIGYYSKPSPSILDIGTGSGCIALTIKHWRPATEVYACDVSDEALAIARENALAHALKVHFVRANMLTEDFLTLFESPFDMIISNPPYVPPHEYEALPAQIRAYEPELALLTGEDPLKFYRAICAHAGELLYPGGWLVLETHEDYAGDVASLLREFGLVDASLKRDLAGKDRIVFGRKESS